MRFFIAAYPWDLMDASLDDVLDRLRGELGVTGMAVHVGCPAALQLRIRDVEPRIVRSRGGLFFRPSPERYESTRCKPIVSGRIGKTDALAGWARACTSRDLDLRVMISAGATGRMAERYTDAACKNVFGDHSRLAVCLSNPDVQAYLVDVVADLSGREGIGGVCLNDFVVGWLEAFVTELEAPVTLTESDRTLLATCFCESCQQRAAEHGLDPALARRAVQLALESRFERNTEAGAIRRSETGAPAADYRTLCERNKPFARYVEQQATGLAALLDRLGEACRVELLVRTSEHDPLVGNQHPVLRGQTSRLPARSAESPNQRSGPTGMYELSLGSTDTADVAFPMGAREVAVWSALQGSDDAPCLVSLVAQAVAGGVHGVMFEHWGLWDAAGQTAIKQAVRFARRTAEG
jgi:hypothetical protein